MFLKLAHTKLDIYESSRLLVVECYKVTKTFPAEEKFTLVQQIRRAAVSVLLNIAEGCSRKSMIERNRFFIISRGSLIEVDTALDLAIGLNFCTEDELKKLGALIIKTFKMLCGLISKPPTHH